jgi:hypothetical protein
MRFGLGEALEQAAVAQARNIAPMSVLLAE